MTLDAPEIEQECAGGDELRPRDRLGNVRGSRNAIRNDPHPICPCQRLREPVDGIPGEEGHPRMHEWPQGNRTGDSFREPVLPQSLPDGGQPWRQASFIPEIDAVHRLEKWASIGADTALSISLVAGDAAESQQGCVHGGNRGRLSLQMVFITCSLSDRREGVEDGLTLILVERIPGDDEAVILRYRAFGDA